MKPQKTVGWEAVTAASARAPFMLGATTRRSSDIVVALSKLYVFDRNFEVHNITRAVTAALGTTSGDSASMTPKSFAQEMQ